jgi:multicomponent Na+:H+ antiporter subunit A
MEILLVVLFSFSGALLSPLLYRLMPKNAGLLLPVIPLLLFAWASVKMWGVVEGEVFQETMPWISTIGLDLYFRVDGLSVFFLMLITGFGILIHIYANSYLSHDANRPKFFIYLSLFMGSMVGLVLSGSLLLMFVFWELTSLSSYLLIGYYHHKEKSRDSALQAMLVTVLGGLFMLAGIILLGYEAGTFRIDELMANPNLILSSPMANVVLMLLFVGALTKSAQFPFHFWLPNAMEAPAPVSAYLHSTTMVKAGIFLLARISPIFSEMPLWTGLLPAIGGFTMVYGAIMAYLHTDLKKILAYTTISALGIMVMLLGIGTTIAVQAALVFVLAHALYKGTLFMVAGNIDHETGSRDVNLLSGLRKKMPFTFIAAILAALSMSGVLPFFGFIAKEILYDAAAHSPGLSLLTISAAFVAGAVFAAIAIELGYKIFFGPQVALPKKPHEAPPGMLAGPLVAALLGLIGGLFVEQLAKPLLHHSANVVLKVDSVLKLTLWHGFNLIFVLSLLTLATGFGIYLIRNKIRAFALKRKLTTLPGPELAYQGFIPNLLKTAKMQTKFFQSGLLRNYLMVIAMFFVGLVVFVFVTGYDKVGLDNFFRSTVGIKWHEILVVFMMAFAIVYTVTAQSRLTAIVSMGLVGYGTALVFLFFGAPDVAMTQFLIETLTVVLFILILNKLPKFVSIPSAMKYRLLIPSLLFGFVMAFLLLWLHQMDFNPALKEFFAENSYAAAKGKNIVNVILVDFRGLDTLGEITVLAIAAIGVYSLLKVKEV